MRTINWQWGGKELSFVPTMEFLSDVAAAVHRDSRGCETTISLCNKLNSGGAEPVFMATPIRLLLKASGVEKSRDDCYSEMMEDFTSVVHFRMAFISAFMPSVDFGKKPDAPQESPAPARAKRQRKK